MKIQEESWLTDEEQAIFMEICEADVKVVDLYMGLTHDGVHQAYVKRKLAAVECGQDLPF